ncbi:MAG TPA: flagellar basal body rod protein FlgB [Acidobacteriota bacterium]|nr:flagellar basal body rod protein FlgB [Acidobacteriota bacterium]
MLSKLVFDRIGVPANRKFLDLAALRHRFISGNVANASTPGYKARDIDFKTEFARMTSRTSHIAGYRTDQRHIPLGSHQARQPEVQTEPIARGDMNSVDIDREVSNMAQNELLFTVGARLLQKKFEGLRKAITSK